MEEKMYEVMDDANQIVKKLAERYAKVLWAVKPDEVVVLGVTNKEPPKGSRVKAKITKINPLSKALLHHKGVEGVRFVIEVFCSEYSGWTLAQKQWVLFHELLHIPRPDENSLLKHDVEDMGVILEAVGMGWFSKSTLPDLLDGEPIAFKEDLALKLHNLEEVKNED